MHGMTEESFKLLYFGNCLDVIKTLTPHSVNAIITDPLYDLSHDEIREYMNSFYGICKGAIVVFCPPENQWHEAIGEQPRHYHYWIKPISTKNTSKNPSRFVEQIEVYHPYTWNANRHWSQYTNVHTDIVDTTKLHPFSKPISLMKRLILNYTNPGDMVVDPFMGSGTTGKACVELGRKFIGIEQDPDYFETAKENIESVCTG